jgi:hypothetical protein
LGELIKRNTYHAKSLSTSYNIITYTNQSSKENTMLGTPINEIELTEKEAAEATAQNEAKVQATLDAKKQEKEKRARTREAKKARIAVIKMAILEKIESIATEFWAIKKTGGARGFNEFIKSHKLGHDNRDEIQKAANDLCKEGVLAKCAIKKDATGKYQEIPLEGANNFQRRYKVVSNDPPPQDEEEVTDLAPEDETELLEQEELSLEELDVEEVEQFYHEEDEEEEAE